MCAFKDTYSTLSLVWRLLSFSINSFIFNLSWDKVLTTEQKPGIIQKADFPVNSINSIKEHTNIIAHSKSYTITQVNNISLYQQDYAEVSYDFLFVSIPNIP